MSTALAALHSLLDCWTNRAAEIGPEMLGGKVVYDTGIEVLFGAEAVGRRMTRFPGYTNVTVLDGCGDDERAALVFEGIDVCTGLAHRVALFGRIEGGKLVRIDETFEVIPMLFAQRYEAYAAVGPGGPSE